MREKKSEGEKELGRKRVREKKSEGERVGGRKGGRKLGSVMKKGGKRMVRCRGKEKSGIRGKGREG